MQRSFWDWVFFIIDRYGLWLLSATGTTLLIALSGTVTGFCIGLAVGVVRALPASAHLKRPSASADLAHEKRPSASADSTHGERTSANVSSAHGKSPSTSADLAHGKRSSASADLARLKRFSARAILLKLVQSILAIYIEVFRGTPMIVQAMVIYYGLLEFFGIDLQMLMAAFVIVSINTGAYMAEIVRGGIDSIDPGQSEAARAIGMTHMQMMLHVVLPQAIRNILPAIGNEFIINIKDTSVLNVISVTELFFMTKSIKGALFRTYEPFMICAAIYLFLTFTTSRLLRMIERKMDGPKNYAVLQSPASPEPEPEPASQPIAKE